MIVIRATLRNKNSQKTFFIIHIENEVEILRIKLKHSFENKAEMSRIRSTPFIHLNMHSCVYLGSSGLEKCHQLQPDCLIQHYPFCTAQRCNHQNPSISPFLPISQCTNEAKSSRLVYSSTKSSTQGLL